MQRDLLNQLVAIDTDGGGRERQARRGVGFGQIQVQRAGSQARLERCDVALPRTQGQKQRKGGGQASQEQGGSLNQQRAAVGKAQNHRA